MNNDIVDLIEQNISGLTKVVKTHQEMLEIQHKRITEIEKTLRTQAQVFEAQGDVIDALRNFIVKGQKNGKQNTDLG
jgi:hypothetical protein